jgi:hypothetical protein
MNMKIYMDMDMDMHTDTPMNIDIKTFGCQITVQKLILISHTMSEFVSS